MTRMTAKTSLPTAYELKRHVANVPDLFWLADRLATLPSAPIYIFPDQQAFDSDEVDLMSRRILAGPLQLPHPEVIFEVTDATTVGRAVVVYARALEDTVDLDVFDPPREDWLNKTDDYLRHGPSYPQRRCRHLCTGPYSRT